MNFKKLIRNIAAIVCIATFVGFGISDAVVIANSTKTNQSDDVSDKNYDIVFNGNVSINEISYDVSLKGNDNIFILYANNFTVTEGTYEFTEGQGYAFTFNDKNGTIVRSQFEDASKSFGILYNLDLGTARGNDVLKLSMEDEQFSVVGEAWNDIPVFVGTAGWFGGSLTGIIRIVCDAEGNFKTISPDVTDFDIIEGTYELSDESCVFTAVDGTVYTATKNSDGLFEVVMPIIRPSLAAYGAELAETTIIQSILTVD